MMRNDMDKLRLLCLTTSYPNQVNPASGVFIRRLLKSFPDSIEIGVATPDSNRNPTGRTVSNRITVYPFRYAPRKHQVLAHQPGGLPVARRHWTFFVFLPVLGLSALLAVCKHARHADVLHGHWAHCGFVAGIAGKVTGKPVVTTLWGTDLLWAQRSFLFRSLLWACVRLSDRVVAVSSTMQDQVAQWFPKLRHKVVVIENGVDMVQDTIASHSKEGFCIGVIGNLIPLKGVDQIIRAMKELTPCYPDVRLLIVGDGPERAALQSLVLSLQLESRVHFVGSVPPEDVPLYLKQCSALVLASSSEGRPNIVLEAMACGVPVVASNIPAVRELVDHGHTGLLYPVGDWRRMADQLKALMEDAGMGARLSRNAGKMIESRQLTWQYTGKQYAAMYRRVHSDHCKRKRLWRKS